MFTRWQLRLLKVTRIRHQISHTASRSFLCDRHTIRQISVSTSSKCSPGCRALIPRHVLVHTIPPLQRPTHFPVLLLFTYKRWGAASSVPYPFPRRRPVYPVAAPFSTLPRLPRLSVCPMPGTALACTTLLHQACTWSDVAWLWWVDENSDVTATSNAAGINFPVTDVTPLWSVYGRPNFSSCQSWLCHWKILNQRREEHCLSTRVPPSIQPWRQIIQSWILPNYMASE